MESLFRIAVVSLLAACLVYVLKALSVAYNSDLRKIPGPFLCRFTNLPLKYHVLTANRMYWVYALHQQYGPFVRIAPNEVALADTRAIHEVHKVGTTFTKSEWYQNQTATQVSDNTCGVFGVRDQKKASHRRKFFQQANTKAALMEWQPRIRSIVDEAISKIKRDATTKGKADVMKWWMMMTSDVLASLTFGEPFDIVKNETVSDL